MAQAGSIEEMKEIAEGDGNMERALAFMERFVNDEEVRGIYDKINDVERDAKERGIAEGLAEGLVEGIKKTAKNLLRMDFKIEDIMEATGLSKEEIEALK